MLPGIENHAPDMPILFIALLMFSIGAIFSYILQRLRLPTFLAFILTGVLLGSDGLNLVQAEEIRPLAQIGIIFLLFIVGLDLSFDKIKRLRYQAPLAGVLQLAFTTVILTFALRYLAALPWQLSFLLASILSLSSTAIVLKSLEEHREMDSDHGRLILGVLIIQDLSIIPLMALIPLLTQPIESDILANLGWIWLKAILFGIVAVAVSLKLVPVFLDRLASTNRQEVFTLALVCVSLGMALLTHALGLSYEAGAFIAGLALSQSVFCRQVISDSKAFRDVFITLFFVSMGLLFDVGYILRYPGLILVATTILVLLKGLCAYGAVRVLKFPNQTALWSGLALFQVGEFSFILLERTLETVGQVPRWEALLSHWSPVLIDAIIISMFLTPLVLRAFRGFLSSRQQARRNLPMNLEEGTPLYEEDSQKVVIGGFGPTAKNLAIVLEKTGIPYSVVEMNLKTVRQLQAKGIHCVYGDISREDVLKEAGLREASILVLTMPDIRTSEATIQSAKRLNKNIHIIVRSRYRADVDRLYKQGVDQVIHEEFETSISFIFHIMRHLDYPIVETDRLITKIRESENALVQEAMPTEHPIFGRFSLLEGTKIEWIELPAESSLIGKTLQASGIRQRTGVNVIALVNAEDKSQMVAEPHVILKAQDLLVAVGSVEQLQALEVLLYEASA